MHSKITSASRTFYPTREWKRAFTSFLLIGTNLMSLPIVFIVEFALWASHLFNPIQNLLFGIGVYIAYVLMGFFIISLFTKPIRHIATSEGITFCSVMYRIYTPWDNIRGIGTSRIPPALLLEQPAVKGHVREKSHLERAIIERRWLLTTKKDAPDDAIPLLFTVPANWQESELGLYIKHYAPQAFNS